MKTISTSLFLFLFALSINAQIPFEANLLGNYNRDDIQATSWLNSVWNEVWGVAINDHEIGIIGSTEGVHFVDVTDPANFVELTNAFVEGAATGSNLVHRDYHDYNGYLYTVADEGPSTLQIIDISDLPNSTSVVYDNNEFIVRAHNIFIEEATARMYACGVSTTTGSNTLRILSLDDPTQPTVMASFPNGSLNLPYVHDIYVEDNLAFLNCGNSGFYVVDFTDPANPNLRGTMTNYPQSGYNHSGWLHQSGEYYYLADENWGRDVKVVDVKDLTDMSVINTFNSESNFDDKIPHNLIVRDNLLYVSYYYDGLQVFDISDPANPVRIAYYDTYPGPDAAFYAGAWGVYPLFPSGNILVSDMQGGLFIIEAIEYTPPTAVEELPELVKGLSLAPNPAQDLLQINITLEDLAADVNISLVDLTGRVQQRFATVDLAKGENRLAFELDGHLANGMYLLRLESPSFAMVKQMIVQR